MTGRSRSLGGFLPLCRKNSLNLLPKQQSQNLRKRKRLPLQNRQKLPESAAAPESGDRFDQLEQMVNHKKRTEPQPAPAAKPIKPVVVETPAPRSRLKRILDFFKLRR